MSLDSVIAVVEATSPWALTTALLVGFAVLLLWPATIDAGAAGPHDRPLPGWLRGRPDSAALGRRVLCGAVLGAAVSTALLRVGMPLALAAGGLAAAGGAIALGWLEPSTTRTARQRRIADAPQALDLLAACLGAGLAVRAALRAVMEVVDGPLGDDLRQVLRLTELGHDDVSAWRTLAEHEQLGPAALDLARSVDTGSLLVETLLVHADTARQQRHGQVEAAARRVGVRSVLPLMTCFIPAFLLLGVVPTVASALMKALSF